MRCVSKQQHTTTRDCGEPLTDENKLVADAKFHFSFHFESNILCVQTPTLALAHTLKPNLCY